MENVIYLYIVIEAECKSSRRIIHMSHYRLQNLLAPGGICRPTCFSVNIKDQHKAIT